MILIAEDDSVIRMILKRIILRHSPKVETLECEDGQEALDKINEDCQLVFTDNNMPRVSGMDFIKKIRMDERFLHIPVVMVTVENRPEYKARGAEMGISGWITKPFNEKDITSYLDIYLKTNLKVMDHAEEGVRI